MKSKIKFTNLNRLLFLVTKILFKDPKIYVVSILIPMVLSFLLYWVWGKMIVNVIYTPQLFGFLSIGSIMVGFYLSLVVTEWKSTNFLKKIKGSGISSLDIMLVLFVNAIIFSFISIVFSASLAAITTRFIPMFPIDFSMLINATWYIWIFFLLSSFLMSIVSLMIFISISNISNNKYIILAINTAALFIIILLCDLTIIPYITSKIKFIAVLEYLNPLKYCVWIIYLITSYQFIDSFGIQQILSTNNISGLFVSFNNIYIPLFISVLVLISMCLYIKYKFSWGVKN
ncbi:hypothetical protein SAPIS_v1c06300 [Spiroplasma apis B31]|uniref:Uncharacterized protein n=1 Tax=Spiroplasma apis B31 TaxID=1276258 RepID=V5RKY6_SPIAP|nr:hypothetical protein SAPIS_v1c06300 [Spiroplasma apis B31]